MPSDPIVVKAYLDDTETELVAVKRLSKIHRTGSPRFTFNRLRRS